METFTNFINVFNTCLSSVSSIYCVLIYFVDFMYTITIAQRYVELHATQNQINISIALTHRQYKLPE